MVWLQRPPHRLSATLRPDHNRESNRVPPADTYSNQHLRSAQVGATSAHGSTMSRHRRAAVDATRSKAHRSWSVDLSAAASWGLLKRVGVSWVDDYVASMGAALAFYTMFSLAPLLLIVVSVAGLVFGEQAARGEIAAQLGALMGDASAEAVQNLLASVRHPREGATATALGVLLLLVGATSVFGELQDALDRIWRAPSRRRMTGLWALLRTRLLSFSLILAIGFLLVVSLLASAAMSSLGRWWGPVFKGWYVLAVVINAAVAFLLVATLFALIYKYMPRARVLWRDVWIGALFTAVLFTIGQSLIGLYMGRSGVTSAFGAAGSLVVLLTWVYYSAQIFLIGAEFTWVYAHTFGSRRTAEGWHPPMAPGSQQRVYP